MSNCVVKLSTKNKTWYLVWSSVVDAPVTWGGTLDDCRKYLKIKFGTNSLNYFDTYGIPNIEKCGHSAGPSWGKTVEEFIAHNRAGKNETEFSKEQIIEWYCRKKKDPKVEGIMQNWRKQDGNRK